MTIYYEDIDLSISLTIDVTYDCGLLLETFAPEPYEICSDAYSIIEVALENAYFMT
jgi:hypothetical protein